MPGTPFTCMPKGALATSFTSSTPWSKNLAVSETMLDVASEPAMDVSSKGLIVIAAIVVPHYDSSSPTLGSAIGVWRSKDGGASFQRVALLKPADLATAAGDPTVLFDQQDLLTIAWAEWSPDATSGEVMAVHSKDGMTLSSPEHVDPSTMPVFRDRPWLALAPDGDVVLSWAVLTTSLFGSTGAKRAVSHAGGPFGSVETIEPSGDYVPSPLSFAPGVTLAVAENGSGFRAWRDLGAGWSAVGVVNALDAVQPLPQLRWSEAVGFNAVFLGAPRYAVQIYSVHSEDQGRSWIGPTPIDDGSPGGGSKAMPWSTIDEKGRLHLMWLDNKDGGWVPYTSMSEDGVHFHAAERIGDAAFQEDGSFLDWIGDFNALVVRGGRRYATWSDSRTGHSGIYFSTALEVE
jgi:hypothetical protein